MSEPERTLARARRGDRLAGYAGALRPGSRRASLRSRRSAAPSLAARVRSLLALSAAFAVPRSRARDPALLPSARRRRRDRRPAAARAARSLTAGLGPPCRARRPRVGPSGSSSSADSPVRPGSTCATASPRLSSPIAAAGPAERIRVRRTRRAEEDCRGQGTRVRAQVAGRPASGSRARHVFSFPAAPRPGSPETCSSGRRRTRRAARGPLSRRPRRSRSPDPFAVVDPP